MRRLCFVLACVCAMLLLACSDSSAKPVTSGFRCQVETEFDQMKITATLDRTDPSKTTISFTEPRDLNGLLMVYEDDILQLQYAGLSFDIPHDQSALQLVVTSLCDALESVDRDDLSKSETLNTTVSFDPITGYPISIELRDVAVVFRLSNWELPA